MSLTAELLKEFERDLESLALIPSDGGRFEVTVDGNLLFSKLALGRHASDGEIVNLVREWLDASPTQPTG